MGLTTVLVRFGLLTGVLLLASTIVIIGPDRLRTLRRQYRQRLLTAAPYIAMLVLVIGINSATRSVAPEISWILNWNITGLIYSIEGNLVAEIQSVASPSLTAFFSFVYLYGYGFLLMFPFVAYFALEETHHLKQLSLAYTINYSLGLVLYILFIAYGPRNFIPDLVEPLLYNSYPQSQLLTRQVNVNTNVFPSLHSSLAITVAVFAWLTRDIYNRWYPVAVFLAGCIVLSTMYLGIHWVIDVIGGGVLGVASVYIARRRLMDPQTSNKVISEGRNYIHPRRTPRD